MIERVRLPVPQPGTDAGGGAEGPVDDDALDAYLSASMSESTKTAYTREWGGFVEWCRRSESAGRTPLPAHPRTVARYLAFLAGRRKAAGIDLALAAICAAHRIAGYPSPRGSEAVQRARSSIRRAIDIRPTRKTPVVVDDLRRIIEAMPDENPRLALRDQALILLGFIGALRRSELVALEIEHLSISHDGLLIEIPRSKHDQEGKGATVAVPPARHPELCPIAALEAWLAASDVREGHVFRGVDRWGNVRPHAMSTQTVANAIKRAIERVEGLNPARFAGHSLRSGFITAAAVAGKQEHAIMNHSRLRSILQVRDYVQRADPWRNNAADGLL